MGQISGLRQKYLDFSKIMSEILDPGNPTFWNSVSNIQKKNIKENEKYHDKATQFYIYAY